MASAAIADFIFGALLLKVATSNVETLPVTVNFLVEPYPLTITSPKSLPLL